MRTHRVRRVVRAYWRDTRVLIKQFRVPLLAFVVLMCGGAAALALLYVNPETGQRVGWAEAIYAALNLVFFSPVLPFPTALGLQLVFILTPVVGLALVADGVLRFGVALFNRRGRKEAWQVAIASTYRDHVIVCGLGRIGYRVVNELLRLGEDVVGIEAEANAPFVEMVRDLQVPVLVGDARRRDMLEMACVKDASAIVVCTQDDLTNLDVALEAREINPGIKVVLRMFDEQLADRVRRGFSIHTAFSTSALAAPVFAAAATRAQIDHSLYLDEVLLNVARTEVREGSALEGRAIGEMEKELDITCILHRGSDASDLHPQPEAVLRAGDSLVVFASLEALSRLRCANGEAPDGRQATVRRAG
jgi:voltage-gated potassium channel